MYQGNWKCSQCGGSITELPFQPRSEAGLTCRSCFMKSKSNSASTSPDAAASENSTEAPSDIPEDAGLAGEAQPMDDGFEDATPVTPGEKKKFEGSWTCATCGNEITSLPFQPRDTSNLKCIECFKASKQ